MKQRLTEIANQCVDNLMLVDFDRLPVSEYNLHYIHTLLPHLHYHFTIYATCIEQLKIGEPNGQYIVDFGGGHGFLSYYLKSLGFNIVYCDNNPLSVAAMGVVADAVGYTPDVVVEGSVDELAHCCEANGILPGYLVSTDVIEHIYDLEAFFYRLHNLNPAMQMVFTTQSNPVNYYKRSFQYRMMEDVERNYFQPMRLAFIEKNYGELHHEVVVTLAERTRGLIYADVERVVEAFIATGLLPTVHDRRNACDPNSGNWMERVLPLGCYRKIASDAGYKATFSSGFYNLRRANGIKSFVFQCLNRLIRVSGSAGLPLAPFICICINKKRAL